MQQDPQSRDLLQMSHIGAANPPAGPQRYTDHRIKRQERTMSDVVVETHGGVALVILNRPQRLNAFG